MPKPKVNPGTVEDWMVRAFSAFALAARKAEFPVVLEDLCFQAQQASEKAIKAVCKSRGLEFGFTHDLGELTDFLDENGVPIPTEVDDAAILSRYAVQTRYPGLYPPLSDADWSEAVFLAKGVVRWASVATGFTPGVELDDLSPDNSPPP